MKSPFLPSAGTPGFDLDAAFAHQRLVDGALVERVGFELVDGRDDLAVVDEVDQPVQVEVRNPYRAGEAVLVDFLHGAPLAVVVPERLVDQVQVEVVHSEPAERVVEGALGVVLNTACRGVLDPELGSDEQFLTGDAAVLDAAPTAASLP
ncbi:hypothetical protein HNP00_001788 [Arthrobacter sp. AZCC_0090]|nr:hypothetical protein [Arthrobacter sp. AZCC_0090]